MFFPNLFTTHLYRCVTREKLITNFVDYKKKLRILYNDKCSNFIQLLEKGKSVIVHPRNLQYFAAEIFKVKIGISPTVMTKIFKFCENAIYSPWNDQVVECMHYRISIFSVEPTSTQFEIINVTQFHVRHWKV